MSLAHFILICALVSASSACNARTEEVVQSVPRQSPINVQLGSSRYNSQLQPIQITRQVTQIPGYTFNAESWQITNDCKGGN